MKKLVKLLLCMTLVLALTGCGKEQTATYKYEESASGISMTDTQIISAKGDKILTLNETTEFTFDDSITEEQISLVAEAYDESYAAIVAALPEGVEMTYGLNGNVYKMNMILNYEEADIDKLIEAGLVEAPEGQDAKKIVYISFKQTCDGLEAIGYTLVE